MSSSGYKNKQNASRIRRVSQSWAETAAIDIYKLYTDFLFYVGCTVYFPFTNKQLKLYEHSHELPKKRRRRQVNSLYTLSFRVLLTDILIIYTFGLLFSCFICGFFYWSLRHPLNFSCCSLVLFAFFWVFVCPQIHLPTPPLPPSPTRPSTRKTLFANISFGQFSLSP